MAWARTSQVVEGRSGADRRRSRMQMLPCCLLCVRDRVRRKLGQMGRWTEDADPADADAGSDSSGGE